MVVKIQTKLSSTQSIVQPLQLFSNLSFSNSNSATVIKMTQIEENTQNHCKLMIMQKRRALLPKPKKTEEKISNKSVQIKNEEEVKLAALAISFNIRLRSSDMPSAMQERALRHTRALLDSAASAGHRRPNPTLLARSLKKEFDSVYGPAWHCVAGKSFGSFVTHSPGGFVYFSVDSLSFLLFKTEVHLIT